MNIRSFVFLFIMIVSCISLNAMQQPENEDSLLEYFQRLHNEVKEYILLPTEANKSYLTEACVELKTQLQSLPTNQQSIPGVTSKINELYKILSIRTDIFIHEDLKSNPKLAAILQMQLMETCIKLQNAIVMNKPEKSKFMKFIPQCINFGASSTIALIGLYRIIKGNWSIAEKTVHNPYILVGLGSAIAANSGYQLYTHLKKYLAH